MGSNPTGPTIWPWDLWGLSYSSITQSVIGTKLFAIRGDRQIAGAALRPLSAFLLQPPCTRLSRFSSLGYSARLAERSAGLSCLPGSFPQNKSDTPTRGKIGHIHDRSKLRSTGSKDGSRRKAGTIEDSSPRSSSPDNSQVKPNHGKHGDKAIQLRPKMGTRSVGRLMLALSRLPKTKALHTKHFESAGKS